jgi:hypothetical protein
MYGRVEEPFGGLILPLHYTIPKGKPTYNSYSKKRGENQLS